MPPQTSQGNIDGPSRDRALRLIKYLQALTSLRTKIVRDIESYENILWLHEIPHEKGCVTQAWGISEEIGPDIWIEIQKTNEPPFPKIPEGCEQWVNKEVLRDTINLPTLFSTIAVQVEVQSQEEDSPQLSYEEWKLEDYPEIQQEWNQYLEEQWLPWAELHRRWQAVQEVYTSLFAIHQSQQRLGEEYELVLGVGLLTWQTLSGQIIRRHLVTAKASLDFEAKLGKFTVVPDLDGPQLSPELDMIEPEEQPFRAQQLAMEGLLSADDNPWDRSSVDSVLHGLAKALHALGEYRPDSLESHQVRAENKPVVEFAPALILRKRSLRGLKETLNKMFIQISEGGEIPSEFLDLAEGKLSHGRNELDSPHEDSTDKREEDQTIYFPKPSNEEQRRIIQTLRSTSGVLVQGPPGTGKSHTIANLICHLLATGKRVLVTAQTPRALEVLQNHLPENIRPLCISLLGSGNKEQRALEASVSGILMRETHWNASNATSQVAELEEKLHQSRKEKAQIAFRLRSIRESETHSQTILNGTYQGTAAKIAQQLNKESAAYGWLSDCIHHDQEIPIPLNDFEKLREALTHLPPELETELELTRPDPEKDLISKESFKELVQKELEAKTLLDSNHELLNSQLAQMVQQAEDHHVHNIVESIERLIAETQRIKTRPMRWIESAVIDMLSDNDRPWKELHRISEESLIILKERVGTVDRQEVEIPKDTDRRKLLNDAKVLKRYFDQGGTIKWPWWRNNKIVKDKEYVLKQVRVDGHHCDSPEILNELVGYLSVEQVLEYNWNIWKGKAEKREDSYLLQVAELEELLEALARVVGLFDLLENAKASVHQVQRMESPVWHDLNALQGFLEVCHLIIAKRNLEKIQMEVEGYVSRIQELTQREPCHRLTQQSLNCLRSRDLESYAKIIFELLDFQKMSGRLNWAQSTLKQLARIAPRFAEELKATPQDPIWTSRISSVDKAWNWARAHSWIREFLNKEDVPGLECRAKQIEDYEKEILAELAAIRSWQFCFSRFQKEHRAHLIGWQQAIRKIKKGTGKKTYILKHTKDAQKHLNKCREAVPAWVMPLHRLWDTVDPSAGMFDVIIVDEASQCGPESLPLAYLGKKLLVVGDDQQISPEAVGLNRGAVHKLMQEHLHDFDHADSFDVESSLFDHGKRRFGNRIVLREHFRCMPEIIRFSNDLCYHDTPLIPLRQYPPERLEPLRAIHVQNGYREGEGSKTINRAEAEAIVRQIIQCCQDERYQGKTMGVIVLQGEAQGHLIETLLVEQLGAEEMEERKLICGNPYHFQGDERQVMFLSMVAAPNQRIGAFTKATDQRRFNVAASRAEDQMWLFHSATRNDLSDTCLRKRLLEFFQNPSSQISQALGEEAEQLREKAHFANRQIENPPQPFDSWFELDVCLAIAAKGYRVIPQYPIAGKFIDLVVEGQKSQLAVECDGDHWHGPDQYAADTERQRKLERAGWQFYRIRECLFNANPQTALEGLWNRLRQLKIFPVGFSTETTSGNGEKVSEVISENTAENVPFGAGTNIEFTSQKKPFWEDEDTSKYENAEDTPPITPSTKTEIIAPHLKTKGQGNDDFEFDGYQAPYAQWRQEILEDPRHTTLDKVIKGLVSIISVEGPMPCHRVYFLYARAVAPPILRVGGQIRSTFNEAISKALRQGLVEGRDEHGNRELYCRIVRKVGTPAVVVRKRGGRDFDEIPPSELGAVMKYHYRQNTSQNTDQLLQSILQQYDFGRMTSNIRESLMKIKDRYLN